MSGFEKALQAGKVVRIKFTKKDGSSRTLIGTTDLQRIPKVDHPRAASNRTKPEGVQTIYDLEIGEWRSIRFDSVQEWKETEFHLN
jgi:hypothetical protein